MPKLVSAVFVLLILLAITSQASGQQAQPAHRQPRGHMPYTPSNNNYQVWVGIDLSRYSPPPEKAVAYFPLFPGWNQHTDIAGVWSTDEIPGLVLTLLSNGDFSLATAADLDKRCSSGVERGNWAWHEQTSQLFFRIKTDTNGLCGFSDTGASMTIHTTETGLSLSISEPAATLRREVPLVRR